MAKRRKSRRVWERSVAPSEHDRMIDRFTESARARKARIKRKRVTVQIRNAIRKAMGW
jgi:hypothetical protein